MKIQTYRKLNLFFSVLILFLLTNACSRYCAIYHPCVVKDSIVSQTDTIHFTKWYPVKPDSVAIFVESECPQKDTIIKAESGRLSLKYTRKNNVEQIEGKCKEDSIKAENTYLKNLIKHYKTIKPDTIFKTPVWNWIIGGAMGVIILLLIIRVIFKR